MPRIFEYSELDDFRLQLLSQLFVLRSFAFFPSALLSKYFHTSNLPLLTPPKRPHCAGAGTCKDDNFDEKIAIDSSRHKALLLTHKTVRQSNDICVRILLSTPINTGHM